MKTTKNNYKKKRNFLKILLIFFISITLSLTSLPQKTKAADLQPGKIEATSEAEILDLDIYEERYKITLKIDSKNLNISSSTGNDIILVVDTSTSMENSNKLMATKKAANSFIDSLLYEGNSNRIALVQLNRSEIVSCKFSNDKEYLKSIINNLIASGETNMEAALTSCKNLLDNSSRKNAGKHVVFISDGIPTRCSIANKFDPKDIIVNHQEHSLGLKLGAIPTGYSKGKYKYCENGQNIKTKITSICPECNKEVTDYVTYKTDGSVETLNAFDSIQKTLPGTSFYTVGLDLQEGSVGDVVLSKMQTNGYVNIKTSVDDSQLSSLEDLLKGIAEDIKTTAGSNAITTDILDSNFSLVDNSLVASSGIVSFDPNTNSITWNIGNLKENSELTLSYEITLNKDAYRPKLYTPNNAKLNYIKPDGTAGTIIFPSITVPCNGYTTYKISYLEEGTNKELHPTSTFDDLKVGTSIDISKYILNIEGYTFSNVSTNELVLEQDGDKNLVTIYYKANSNDSKDIEDNSKDEDTSKDEKKITESNSSTDSASNISAVTAKTGDTTEILSTLLLTIGSGVGLFASRKKYKNK